MNRTTGKTLGGIDHLKQSIIDILTTPIGSRVMRRTYGSNLFSHVDAPMTMDTRLAIFNDTVDALSTWEPRISVQKVEVSSATQGQFVLSLTGTYLPNGKSIAMEGIQVS
ncbi:GPW/gp25 family protein [Celerinatantimonas sp. MCCC 1A17872]|uniref:GPW/gp25 family protein n=1 Tax=Celerinatantimonas sp. MCCC 1A17872 TaxID=3177514 RepID=UPI0038C7A0AF